MYTFSQLLTRNLILSTIYSILATVITLFFLSSYLENKNNQYQRVIISLAKQVLTHSDRQELAVILRKNANYKKLKVSTLSGENLYSYTNKKDYFILPFIAPAPTTLFLKKLDLNIQYQLNHHDISSLAIQLLLTLIFLLNAFVIFACKLSINQHKRFFKAISRQITNELSNINDSDDDESDGFDNLEIPGLKEGISSIKELISGQLSTSSVLEKEAYVDPLTQLNNRGRFVQYYENEVTQDSPIKFGVLLITRCSELQTINQIHGYNEGDTYISTVVNIIKASLVHYSTAELFRLNSSDFACILPNVQLQEAEAFAQQLTVKFNEYQQAAELDSVAYTGLVYFDKSKPLGELLALADTGISVAQTQHLNSWYSQKDTEILKSNSINYGNQNWRQEIENVIEHKRINLLLQPIQPNNRQSKVYGEILARFLNTNNEMLPTVSFIAMAEKLDKIVAIDRLIISSAIEEITNKNLQDQSFGLNISARSLNDEHFLIWLERRLLRESSVAPRLVFEITEHGLQQNIKTSKRFIDMIHRVGSRVTVERFGVALTSFKFFRDLKPDFIKMDSMYTRDIDEDKNNQYFLRLMVDLAHRLGINVLAESVESQEEKHTLSKLFIDGCQGYYIGKPTSL